MTLVWDYYLKPNRFACFSHDTVLLIHFYCVIMHRCVLKYDIFCIRLTNRFHVAVYLFSDGSQMMSKGGKNKKAAASVSLMLLPHFDVFCDLLLNRRMATWNLFVLFNEEVKKLTDILLMHLSSKYRT